MSQPSTSIQPQHTWTEPYIEEETIGYDVPAGRAAKPQNVSQKERWISAGTGAVLVMAGLRRGKLGGFLASSIGAALLHRGITGHCYGYEALGINTARRNDWTAVPAQQGEKVEVSVTIQRPAQELYDFWRNLENLPRIMSHLKDVQIIDATRSRWTAEGAMGRDVQWDAEIISDRPGEVISWRSLPGSNVETAGSVRFRSLPNDRGTAVTVSMKFNPPAGKVGAQIAALTGQGLEQRLTEDLRKFKSLMEAGELPTTDGQPIGLGAARSEF